MEDLVVRLGIACPDCEGPTSVLRTRTRPRRIIRLRICDDCQNVVRTLQTVEGTLPTESQVTNDRRSGFACPRCGGSTMVRYTSPQHGMIRRAHICTEVDCHHEFATRERIDA